MTQHLLGNAILSFDKKMTGKNPGDLNKALLELVNLTQQVIRIKLPDDVAIAIISKLNSLVEEAFPVYKDEVITEAVAAAEAIAAGTGASAP